MTPPAPSRRALEPADVRRIAGSADSVALMRALGLVTPRGGASADAHRKLKQIQHFVTLLDPALRDTFARYDAPVLVDAAAGKGYMGLLLARTHCQAAGRGVVVGIEARPDLAARTDEIATAMSLPFTPHVGAIRAVSLPERVHFVVALHACDTATDEAIVRGIHHAADHIAVVPCCQAEVARLLGAAPPQTSPLAPLWHRAWHKREFGAHVTNVVRALILEAHGYQVTVTELAGWEHSLKNELILARRIGRFHEGAQRRLDALLDAVGVRPWIVDALAASP